MALGFKNNVAQSIEFARKMQGL